MVSVVIIFQLMVKLIIIKQLCGLTNYAKKTNSKIVVSSTWRYCCKEISYQDCLYNAGLNKEIEIVGCTDWFGNQTRTEEIKIYLNKHKEITNYVILDDEEVLDPRFIKCNGNYGFGLDEFYKAKKFLGDDNSGIMD